MGEVTEKTTEVTKPKEHQRKFEYRGTDKSIFAPKLRGGGVLMIMHAIVIRPLTSHPYKAGTEHAGFSPDQARTQSPSAKRRGVFGESHERTLVCILTRIACDADLLAQGRQRRLN